MKSDDVIMTLEHMQAHFERFRERVRKIEALKDPVKIIQAFIELEDELRWQEIDYRIANGYLKPEERQQEFDKSKALAMKLSREHLHRGAKLH